MQKSMGRVNREMTDSKKYLQYLKLTVYKYTRNSFKSTKDK